MLILDDKGRLLDTIDNAKFSWNNSIKDGQLVLFDREKGKVYYNFKPKKVTRI